VILGAAKESLRLHVRLDPMHAELGRAQHARGTRFSNPTIADAPANHKIVTVLMS
jgi:hypothetical protein